MSPTQSARTTHKERDGEDFTAAPPRPSRGARGSGDPDSRGKPRGDIGWRGARERKRRGDAVWGEDRHRLYPARAPGERVQLHRRSLRQRGRRRGCCCCCCWCWCRRRCRWCWWRRNRRRNWRRSGRRGGIPTPIIRENRPTWANFRNGWSWQHCSPLLHTR